MYITDTKTGGRFLWLAWQIDTIYLERSAVLLGYARDLARWLEKMLLNQAIVSPTTSLRTMPLV